MSAKKIIAVSLLGLAAAGIYVQNKVSKIKKQFPKIKIFPAGVRNITTKWNEGKPTLSFDIDLLFKSTLTDNFEINGLFVKLQRIVILDPKGIVVAVATPNVGKITVPANGNYTLKNIPFIIDIQTALINIINYKNINPNSFTYEIIISVLGAEYKIR